MTLAKQQRLSEEKLRLKQILILFRDGYITRAYGEGLAETYAADVAHLANWDKQA
jgi:hypothetical protein